MSVSCTRELEMATEVFSGVYDIVYPSPVSLKNLAAMAVSLEVWRCEIIKHRTSDTLEEFWPSCECILLKTIGLFPDLPSMIADVIEEYVKKFGISIENWLDVQYTKVFRFHYNSKTHILKKFDDFVCDYNGTVHYARTAQRMMDSDGLSLADKFEIACVYFFEDDIRRFWPSVCEKMDSNYISFHETPELYYWICCLRNELEKVPITIRGESVDETMLKQCITDNNSRQSVQYFWDRVPLERRIRTAVSCLPSDCGREAFVRIILPKLDEKQLAEFVNENGVELMHYLLLCTRHDETFVLSTWNYIRHIMNVSEITDMVVKMLQTDVRGMVDYDTENWLYLCIEILNYLPIDSKLTIIRTILSNDNNILVDSINAGSGSSSRTVAFLLRILSCVTANEKNAFWNNCWRLLIPRIGCEDLKRIMDVCFEENEDKIVEFKQNVMIKNDSVRGVCISLWNRRLFDELNKFVSFCSPNTEKARRFKQELLQLGFFGEICCFSIEFLDVSTEFNEFINDAHENADLSTDFKIQLMSLPIVQFRLSQYACEKAYKQLMEFIDIFVPKEQTTLMEQIKSNMIDAVKEKFIGNRCHIMFLYDKLCECSLKTFVVWCLGNEDELIKFQLGCVSEFKQRHKNLHW